MGNEYQAPFMTTDDYRRRRSQYTAPMALQTLTVRSDKVENPTVIRGKEGAPSLLVQPVSGGGNKSTVTIDPVRESGYFGYQAPKIQADAPDAAGTAEAELSVGGVGGGASVGANGNGGTVGGGSGGVGEAVLTQTDLFTEALDRTVNEYLSLLNQPFKFDKKSSPYYNLYMEQYEKRAEQAAANAYSRSVANAGGYGSSYATLAAEQAAGEVWEDFDALVPSMYEAAKSEHEGRKTSLIEQYQILRGLQEDRKAMDAERAEDEAAKAEQDAIAAGTAVNADTYAAYESVWKWMTESGLNFTTDEAKIRAALDNMKLGNASIDVDRVMSMLGGVAGSAAGSETVSGDSTEVTETVNEATGAAYSELREWISDNGIDPVANESAVRAELENLKMIYPDVDVESVVTMLQRGSVAAFGDAVAAFEKAPDLETAQALWQAAQSTGAYGDYAARIQTAVSKMVKGAYDDPDAAYSMLGIDKETWSETKDGDKKALILEKAGELRKSGMLSGMAYRDMVKENIVEFVKKLNREKKFAYGNYNGNYSGILDGLYGVIALFETGYLDESDKNKIFDSVVEELGDHTVGEMLTWNAADKLLAQRDTPATDEQEEAERELRQALSRVGTSKITAGLSTDAARQEKFSGKGVK